MAGDLYLAEHIVAGIAADGVPRILDDAALLVIDGTVAAVGDAATLAAGNPEATLRRDYQRHTLLPGFVNAHHHVGVTPVMRGMPDLPLERWVIRRSAEPTIDAYVDALYGALDMVASGITTVTHLYADKLAVPEAILADSRATISAYRDVGMRVSFAIMFFDQNALGYVGRHVADALPPDERAAAGGIATASADMDFAAHKAVLDALAGEFSTDDGVRIQLAPANLHWCSHASLERFAELAASTRLPVHMHLLETHTQRRYADWRTKGEGPIGYLRSLGFRGAGMTLGHGTWIGAGETAAIAEAGFSVCHNCSSNLRLSSGLAPIGGLLRHGVNVAVGIDEAGLNDDHDMLQEMRLALHLSKAVELPEHPDGIGAGRVFAMATAGGAASIGLGHRIGDLAPGKSADFVAFDHRAAASPGRPDRWSPLDILLHRGRPRHLAGVHVAGEAIARNGLPTRVDLVESLHRVERCVADAAHPDPQRLALLRRIEERVQSAHRAADRDGLWFSR